MKELKAQIYTRDENSWELGLQRRCDKGTGRSPPASWGVAILDLDDSTYFM